MDLDGCRGGATSYENPYIYERSEVLTAVTVKTCLLGCDAVMSVRTLPMFCRKLILPFSR
jgi:hypothetical protein